MLHNTRGKLVCSMSHFIWEWEVLLLMINWWCTLRSPLNIHGELGFIETMLWYQTLDFKFYACITTHCFSTPTFTPPSPPIDVFNWVLIWTIIVSSPVTCPNDVSLVTHPPPTSFFPLSTTPHLSSKPTFLS